MWVRWLRRLLLGNRAFACVLDRNTFRSSNTHPGPPMTLGKMREHGVRRLIAFCHNNACRHQALIMTWRCRHSGAAPSAASAAAEMWTCGRTGSSGLQLDPWLVVVRELGAGSLTLIGSSQRLVDYYPTELI
jgi:hypothetical protein